MMTTNVIKENHPKNCEGGVFKLRLKNDGLSGFPSKCDGVSLQSATPFKTLCVKLSNVFPFFLIFQVKSCKCLINVSCMVNCVVFHNDLS